jgi:hypothetical protein
MNPTETAFLRRYTSLPQLLQILQTGTLTLLDPKYWDDKNDATLIEKYCKKQKLKKVLALCFAESSETYHHWKVYAEGIAGVCIEFNKARLLKAVRAQKKGLRSGSVKYVKVDKLASYQAKVSDWPFIKRRPYEGEKEFRIIYEENSDDARSSFALPIPIDTINRVYLSPWIYRDVSNAVRKTIQSLPNCANLDVYKTSLVDNKRWKDALEV